MNKSKKQFQGRDYLTYSAFGAYSACTVALPLVLVELFKNIDFPLDTGNRGAAGFLQMALSIFMVFSMLACGFCAGKLGKARSLALAGILTGVGMTAMVFCGNYISILIALVLSGIGQGFLEGLLAPYVEDCHPDETTGYLNIAQAFAPCGMLFMVILTAGAAYLEIPWEIPVLLAGIIAIISGILYLFPFAATPGDRKSSPLSLHKMLQQTAGVLKRSRFWAFFAAMLFEGIGEFCITFWIASYLILEYNVSAVISSFALGAWTFFMFLGRMFFGHLIKQQYLRQVLLWLTGITILISLLFPAATLLPQTLAIVSIFVILAIAGMCVAPFWASIQTYCTECIPEEDSTMIFILLSCAGIPGCGIAAWLVGILGDWIGMTPAFFLVPVSYGMILLILSLQKKSAADK